MPTFTGEPRQSPGSRSTGSSGNIGQYSRLPTPEVVVPRTSHQLEQMPLSSPGPHNPAAAVSTNVVKKILDLEFVDMAEISADVDFQVAGRPGGSARPPIATISKRLERYSVMAAVQTTRFPEKAPELFAHQGSIIRAERIYEGEAVGGVGPPVSPGGACEEGFELVHRPSYVSITRP